MLHQTPETTSARPVPQGWRNTIAVGDIIRWTLTGDTQAVALIVDVETVAGWQVLTIAPGVDDHAQPVRPGTLRLTRLDEVRQSGLLRPVRFDLERRFSIAPSHPALTATQEPPVVGHLCERALERLHTQRARIHALRDIAAWRRAERRAARTGDRRTGWRLSPPAAQPQRAQEGRQ
ncbi:hypothetical protein [Paracoccus luteus]|uniref:hypothetical protein n=1 Tax=Paracoccus luteus TaxID=2508543 RepID=UPI00106FE0E4|nr:hypothetical protein [Paracoccus luteus]